MCASKGPFGYLGASISQYGSHYEWRKTTGSNDNGLQHILHRTVLENLDYSSNRNFFHVRGSAIPQHSGSESLPLLRHQREHIESQPSPRNLKFIKSRRWLRHRIDAVFCYLNQPKKFKIHFLSSLILARKLRFKLFIIYIKIFNPIQIGISTLKFISRPKTKDFKTFLN